MDRPFERSVEIPFEALNFCVRKSSMVSSNEDMIEVSVIAFLSGRLKLSTPFRMMYDTDGS